MDKRFEVLQGVLRELGLNHTLQSMMNELQARGGAQTGFQAPPMRRADPNFGQPPSAKRIDSSFNPSQSPINQRDANTPKSSTPEKGMNKTNFKTNPLSSHSDNKAPPTNKDLPSFETFVNISTKSADLHSKTKKPPQPKASNQIIQNSDISYEKADNSHEFSFGEEDSNNNSPVNKSPTPYKYQTNRNANASPVASLSNCPLSQFSFLNPHANSRAMLQSQTNPSPSQRAINYDSNNDHEASPENSCAIFSRTMKNISVLNSQVRSSNFFNPISEDNCIMAYGVNEANFANLVEYLAYQKPYLFPKGNTAKYVGVILDEALVKRVAEETKTLKLDLRVFFTPNSSNIVRQKYKIEKTLTQSTFSYVSIVT